MKKGRCNRINEMFGIKVDIFKGCTVEEAYKRQGNRAGVNQIMVFGIAGPVSGIFSVKQQNSIMGYFVKHRQVCFPRDHD